MRTKPAHSDEERLRAFNELLDQPSIVEIDDATDYWLEGDDGRLIGAKSPTSEAPLLAALAVVRRGVDPSGLSLVCHIPDDETLVDGRYVVGSGPDLVEMAEWAAGIPARPRVPAQRELPGHDGARAFGGTVHNGIAGGSPNLPRTSSRRPRSR
jgi:hypothetical protein